MPPPLIEICGVWISNKGAELMARTAVTELSARLPEARFASMAQGPDDARRRLGMPALPGSRRSQWLKDLCRLTEGTPFYPLTRDPRRAVTHVVDISGFAYGDVWGYWRARTKAGSDLRLGKPYYLMPQSFGPFDTPRLRAEMTRIVTGARLVVARDRTSRAHLQGLASGREILSAPDITFGLDVADRPVSRPDRPYAAVVLNAKLLTAGRFDTDRLLSLYAGAVDRLAAQGWHVAAVLHEPRADRDLTSRLCRMRAVEMVDFDDARDLKAYLAGAECIVTARYHGLVNGLAAGVPCFAVGWAHKYAELLAEFDCADWLHDGDDAGFLARLDTALADPQALAARRAALARIAAASRQRLAQLWDRVAQDIETTGR